MFPVENLPIFIQHGSEPTYSDGEVPLRVDDRSFLLKRTFWLAGESS